MPKELLSAREAARALGISLDTLRRWDRAGKIATERDAANRRIVAASEVARLRGDPPAAGSARNRLQGVVCKVTTDGLLTQVELDITEPGRVVAVITREAAEEMDLQPGEAATAVVKATSVMITR